MEFSGSWDRYIPLMEFSYNNCFQSSIGMAPYESLYGRKCRTHVCWTELNEHKVIGPDIVKDTEEKVQVIRKRLNKTPQKYPIIFIIIFIIYSKYKLSQTWVFPGKLINC